MTRTKSPDWGLLKPALRAAVETSSMQIVADEIGTSKTQVHKLYHGTIPSLKVLRKIAAWTQMTPEARDRRAAERREERNSETDPNGNDENVSRETVGDLGEFLMAEIAHINTQPMDEWNRTFRIAELAAACRAVVLHEDAAAARQRAQAVDTAEKSALARAAAFTQGGEGGSALGRSRRQGQQRPAGGSVPTRGEVSG